MKPSTDHETYDHILTRAKLYAGKEDEYNAGLAAGLEQAADFLTLGRW
jgi:hypothetical protein